MIMLDCGAYSAWKRKRGDEINLAAYIGFVQHNKDVVNHYIALDTIAGRNGEREDNPAAIEQAAQQSARNHRTMKDAGLHPIPVFHMDESLKWLEAMLK